MRNEATIFFFSSPLPPILIQYKTYTHIYHYSRYIIIISLLFDLIKQPSFYCFVLILLKLFNLIYFHCTLIF